MSASANWLKRRKLFAMVLAIWGGFGLAEGRLKFVMSCCSRWPL